MFEITDAWLVTHQSDNEAWTRDQLAAVGVEWPPIKGWKHRIIGTLITDQARERFEMKLDRKAAARHHTNLSLF